MMKDRAIREEMDRLATPNQWKADKEFTDIPDDKFPGKDRIKRALAYAENDRNNTKVQIPEPVGKWLESRGIDVDTLLRLEPLLRKYDSLTDEQKMRFEELKDFEPNPGKATLNQIGETKYVAGDRGLPIYQEDVDMIKKSQPLAKKLVELQKKNQEQEPVEEKPLSEMTTQEKIDYWYAKEEEEEKKQTLRTLKDIIDEVYNVKPEELNVGPDTTENINEISEEDRMNLEAGWYKVPDYTKKSHLKYQEMEKNDGLKGDWQPGVKFPAGAVEKGLVNPGLEYYEATGRRPETPIEKYYVREHMKNLKPEEREHYEKLFASIENEDTPDVMWYFDPESERFKPVSESIDETADEEDPNKIHPIDIIRNWTPDGKKIKTLAETIDDMMYPNKEAVDKAMGECNKNVSDHGKDYSYSSILRQMDETHTRKNNDYGDAAYQGYKKYGPAYFLVQLHNKLSRLESLTINNRSQMVKDESIDDTLLDMANYAVMYLESRHRND